MLHAFLTTAAAVRTWRQLAITLVLLCVTGTGWFLYLHEAEVAQVVFTADAPVLASAAVMQPLLDRLRVQAGAVFIAIFAVDFTRNALTLVAYSVPPHLATQAAAFIATYWQLPQPILGRHIELTMIIIDMLTQGVGCGPVTGESFNVVEVTRIQAACLAQIPPPPTPALIGFMTIGWSEPLTAEDTRRMMIVLRSSTEQLTD